MTAPQEPTELSLERFRTLVEAYGSDLSRMPAGEREAARTLLARSAEARKLLEGARAVDAWLALSHEVLLAPSLMRKLDSIPERHAQEASLRQLVPRRARLWASLSAAAALLLGVLSGMGDNGEEQAELAPDEVSSEPTDQEELALNELSSLALGQELLADLDSAEGASE